jgi:hypothetical protein
MKTVILALMIKVWFLDVETKETLPAVKVTTDKSIYYSNFDGYVNIPNDEKVLKVTYNTYKSVENINVVKDTTILLNHQP